MRKRLPQMNRLKVLTAIAAGLLAVDRASAVITLQSPTRNTAPPPASMLPAWNLQGQFLLFNATPISPSHFIAARHIGGGVGNQITYGTQAYNTTGFTDIAGTDLRVWSIDTVGGTRTFPTFAPIWDPAVDGSEVGKPLVVFGRGVPRTEAIYAPIYPGQTVGTTPIIGRKTLTGGDDEIVPLSNITGPAPTGQGDLRGWKWGTVDALASWGQNNVEFAYTDDTFGALIGFNFDSGSRAGPNEAILSRNDSSGGVFAQSASGQWKLIGVNLGVDGAWSFTANGAYFDAALFDARGLYVGAAADHQYLPYSADPLTASSYSTRVSSYFGDLSLITNNFTNTTGGGTLLPEPTSVLAIVGAGLLLKRNRRNG